LERNIFRKHNNWLAVMVLLCLLVSIFMPFGSAFADLTTYETGSVTVRIEDHSSTLLAKTVVPLAVFDLSEYGYSTSVEGPTALHALIRALEAGGHDPKDADDLTFTGGMLTKLLGVSAANSAEAWMYRLNNNFASAFASQPIQNGDDLVVYFTESWSSSNYAFFDSESVAAACGADVQLTLKECVTDPVTWMESQVGCADATITINGADTAYQTDSDGKVTLNFAEEGTYDISAKKISSDPENSGLNLISLPYCKVVVSNTVSEPEYGTADLKSLAITMPADSSAGLKAGLSPDFSYDVTSYTCILENNASQLQFAAETAAEGAAIQCWTSWDTTPVDFSSDTVFSPPAGESTVTLQISPPAGDETPVNLYQIYITREAAVPVGDKEESINNILTAVSSSYAYTYDYWELLDMTIHGKDNVDVAALLTKARQDLSVLDMTSSSSATTLEKITIALSSRGYDAAHFADGSGGYIDLVGALTNLASMDYVTTYIYGLLALDSGNYESAADVVWSRDDLIDGLLGQALADGGFGFGMSDPDTTAMVVAALAPYYERPEVKTAVDEAMTWLSTNQNAETGGFASWGAENSNSAAMVMIALTSMGKDPDSDPAFVKNGKSVLDALLSYETADHFLKYTDTFSDYSTEQGFRALAAYQAYLENGSGALPIYQFGTPDKTGAEEVTVTSLNLVSGPDKTSYNLGDSFNAAGIVLTASYSDTSLRDVDIADCTISGFSSTTSGSKTVTIAFGGAETTFTVIIKSSGGTTLTNTFTIKVVGDAARGTILAKKTVTAAAGATVFDILQSALEEADIDFTYSSSSGTLYISSIGGLAEFANGPNSGWLYYVNGDKPSVSCGSYKPKTGDAIEFRYSDDWKSGSSLGSDTASADLATVLDKDGIAQASIAVSDITALLKESPAVSFHIQTPETAKGLAVTVAKAAAAALANTSEATLSINSSFATLAFDPSASAYLAAAAKDTGFTVSVEENPEQSAKVGGRPVYDFTVNVGGEAISSFGGGAVTVEIPYTLQEGEDANAVVIYYINEQGELEIIKNAHYDAQTNKVIFDIDHFSTFAVGYNKVVFNDTSGKWMENAVSFMAARNMVMGTGNGEFQPDRTITRAEFAVILMRSLASGDETDKVSQFADISADAYYYDALLQGKALGLLEGCGNNLFLPNQPIARQEMLTIAYRALEKFDLLDDYTLQSDLPGFADEGSIASYARTAIEALAIRGLVNGSEGKVMPGVSASRGECAQFLYNILTAAQ